MMYSASAMPDYEAGLDAYNSGDYASAMANWAPLAIAGDDYAQFAIGLLHDEGLGVEQSYVEAAYWYRKSAEQGNPYSQYNLSNLYYSGDGVPLDYSLSAYWTLKAAEQGNLDAQHDLGYLYAYGEGVDTNYVIAYMWAEVAARMGDETAFETIDWLSEEMSSGAISRAKKLVTECVAKDFINCSSLSEPNRQYPTDTPAYDITLAADSYFNLQYRHTNYEWEHSLARQSPFSTYFVFGNSSGIWMPILDYLNTLRDLQEQENQATTARQRARLAEEIIALKDSFLPKRGADLRSPSNYFSNVEVRYMSSGTIYNEPTELGSKLGRVGGGSVANLREYQHDFREDILVYFPIYINDCAYDDFMDRGDFGYTSACKLNGEGISLDMLSVEIVEGTLFDVQHWEDSTLYHGDTLIMDGYMSCQLDEIEFHKCVFFPELIEVIPDQ